MSSRPDISLNAVSSGRCAALHPSLPSTPAQQMKTSSVVKAVVFIAAVLVGAVAAATLFGGPKPPPPMASINNPFELVDLSDMPPLLRFVAGDGASLAYRYYRPI